ncbi:MAG: hypothetical protein J5494_04190 [Candidatus Methanomethylophilaceae archaeon]|nr:hypothetical protein [Candidatus Methanomethylophilaceae archaeon]
MPEITFQTEIPFTSDFPATMISGVARVYSGIFPGESSEVQADSRTSIGVSIVRCTPPPFPEYIQFDDAVPFDLFVWSRLNDVSIGAVLNLATFEIGTDGSTHIYFVVDIKCTAKATDNVTYSMKYYIRKVEPGTPPNVVITETVIRDWSSMGIIYNTSGTVLNNHYAFGFHFVRLPGRENTPSQYCLWFAYTNAVKRTNTVTAFRPIQSPLGGTIMSYNMTTYNSGYVYSGVLIDFAALRDAYGVEPSAKIYSPQAGEESVQGGMNEPAFDDRSDTVSIPADPTINVSQLGFFNVYATSSLSSLNALSNYVFGSEITTQSTTEDILKAIGNNLFHSKLVDYIVSCHVIPVEPVVGEGLVTIELGNQEVTGVSMPKVTTDYVTFDCGSINLSEYYENFADFLEDAKLFLPFIGFVPARPEWFKNTTLGVQYKFNVVDGSCMVYVTSSGKYTNNGNSGGTVVAQYSGTASIRFPITGVSYSNMATGVIGSVATMATAAAAGSMLGVAGSAINMTQMKPGIAQSNGYNACASMMGVRRPFLYIERPVSSYARNYQHELGIPANIWGTLGDVNGFVKMENVHVDGIAGATDYEKNEIARLLAQGVIV